MIQMKRQERSHQASDVLAKSSVRELRRIRVHENSDTVELSGNVRSFYHKQLAQETVRSAANGRRLVNHVEVCD